MNFLSFLTTPFDQIATKNKTICFKGKKDSYPLLFFSLLFRQLKQTCSHPVQVLSHDIGIALIKSSLATSFLGQASLYWLKNIAAYKPKQKKELVSFLKHYSGLNGAVFFVDETIVCAKKDFGCMIDIPEKIDETSFRSLCSFLGHKSIAGHARLLFEKNKAITIDEACLLIQYAVVNGRYMNRFVDVWMDKIVAPEHSLSTLSSAFFSKDTQRFFSVWSQMEADYSPQFWIVFWSEQLWRAFNFVEYANKGQILEAKRIGFRLPYNVKNYLWQKLDLTRLKDLHDLLYKVDYSLKNGGKPFSLELLYFQYFS